METSSKPKLLGRVSQLWNELSSAFASLFIFASLFLFGAWVITGTSFLSNSDFQVALQTDADKLQLALVMMLCICLAAFLATYTLNCPIRGCGPQLALSLSFILSAGFFAFALSFALIAIGGLAGKQLNSRIYNTRDTRFVHTAFRAVILGVLALLPLAFLPVSDLPFWVVSVVWVLKCGLYLWGAVRSIWIRYPSACLA